MKHFLFIFLFCHFFILNSIQGLCQVTARDYKISVLTSDLPSRTTGLTFNDEGSFYVATNNNSTDKKILKIDPILKIDTIFSLECFAIQFLKTGPGNSLYISYVIERGKNNAGLLKVQKDSVSKVISTGFIQPVGITFDNQNNLYVVDAMQKKVYRISDNEKTVLIDLSGYPESKDVLYHGIAWNPENRALFVAGINLSGGTGNVLRFDLDNYPEISRPAIVCSGNCKQIISKGNKIYVTINTSSLLIKNFVSGEYAMINDQSLINGMALTFGECQPGKDVLYINTFDKIVKLEHTHSPE